MSEKRLLQRIPAVKLGVGQLIAHRLCFHKVGSFDGTGKCDAYQTNDVSHVVYGVLYEIEEEHRAVLDEYEGLGNGYELKMVGVYYDEKLVSAYTYYATIINQTIKPLHWYKTHVLVGARENELPDFYIQQIESIESIADDNIVRHEREIAIYRKT